MGRRPVEGRPRRPAGIPRHRLLCTGGFRLPDTRSLWSAVRRRARYAFLRGEEPAGLIPCRSVLRDRILLNRRTCGLDGGCPPGRPRRVWRRRSLRRPGPGPGRVNRSDDSTPRHGLRDRPSRRACGLTARTGRGGGRRPDGQWSPFEFFHAPISYRVSSSLSYGVSSSIVRSLPARARHAPAPCARYLSFLANLTYPIASAQARTGVPSGPSTIVLRGCIDGVSRHSGIDAKRQGVAHQKGCQTRNRTGYSRICIICSILGCR